MITASPFLRNDSNLILQRDCDKENDDSKDLSAQILVFSLIAESVSSFKQLHESYFVPENVTSGLLNPIKYNTRFFLCNIIPAVNIIFYCIVTS